MKSILIATLFIVGTLAQAAEVSFRVETSYQVCTENVCESSSGSAEIVTVLLNSFGDGEYWFQREFLGDLRLDRSIKVDDWGWRDCSVSLTHTYMNQQDMESFGQMIRCDQLRKVKADRMISETDLQNGTTIRTIQTIYID